MSKKRATMTLKDFHGGSIPSDLPLPSAPGGIVRPSDRVGFDRPPAAWENPMGRSDQRFRPGSAGSVRNFDDKSPFLTHTTRIGRNFDEDERTPLDGLSGPRRTVSDERINVLEVRSEPKMEYLVPSNRPVSNPNPSSYVPRFSGGLNIQNFSGNRVNYQNVGGNSGQGVVGSSPNAWGLKRDVVGNREPVIAPWSASDVASKLAHASALEKVSSGRWHSKQVTNHPQIDVEVIRHPEMESETYSKGYGIHDKVDVPIGRESREAALVSQTERSLTLNNEIRVGAKELPVYERARSPMYSEMKERSHPIYGDRFQAPAKFGGSGLPPAESVERSKLKLLPRSKPLESVEALPSVDFEKGYRQTSDTAQVESGSRGLDRPKMNLKPRSQPLEQLEGNIETKRNNNLFGGARPRELVLKERGIDDVAVNNLDQDHLPNRVKQDVTRAGKLPVHAIHFRYKDKAENIPLNHRVGKFPDRRDRQVDAERKNWRSANRRSGRDLEKQLPPQERQPSPETWRKPVDLPAPPTGPRYGKAASAVDLALAFSKSISDPKTSDGLYGSRGIPGRGPLPFSRLTGPPPRSQLNGY